MLEEIDSLCEIKILTIRHASLLELGSTVQPMIYANQLVGSLSVATINNALVSARGLPA